MDRIVYCGRHFVLSLGRFQLGYLAGRGFLKRKKKEIIILKREINKGNIQTGIEE